MLASEKGLEDLDHITDVCLVGMHSLKSFPDGACWFNARESDETRLRGRRFHTVSCQNKA